MSAERDTLNNDEYESWREEALVNLITTFGDVLNEGDVKEWFEKHEREIEDGTSALSQEGFQQVVEMILEQNEMYSH